VRLYAFIEIFSTTDGRSQSMRSGSKPWTRLRSAFWRIWWWMGHVCPV